MSWEAIALRVRRSTHAADADFDLFQLQICSFELLVGISQLRVDLLQLSIDLGQLAVDVVETLGQW